MHGFMYSIYTHLTQKTCNVFKKNAYLAHTCPTLIWKAGGNEPRNNPCSLQPQRFKCEQTQTRFPLDIFSAKCQHSPAAKARSSPLTHSLRKQRKPRRAGGVCAPRVGFWWLLQPQTYAGRTASALQLLARLSCSK